MSTIRKSITSKKTTEQKTTRAQASVKVDVFDTKGKVVESMALPAMLFKAKENPSLVAQAVRVYLANKRQGTISTKSRGEVEGSTRKIYRQKGTGRARHGGVRAPIFVHGGIAFGPKPRDFSLDLPKKMKRAALFSVLTSRLKDKEIKVVEGLEKIEPKTKAAAQVLKNLALVPQKQSVVVVTDGTSENVFRAARNIKGVELIMASSLNAYDASRGTLLLFMKNSIDLLSTQFGKREKKA